MNKEIVFVGRMQNKTRDYIHNLEREVKLLQQENKELHNKIDKALLKIQDLYEYGDEWHWDNGAIRDYVEHIEEILKDSDVDE